MKRIPLTEWTDELKALGFEVEAEPTELFLMDTVDADGFILAATLSFGAIGTVSAAKVLPLLVEWLLKRKAGHKVEITSGNVKVVLENQDREEVLELLEKYGEQQGKIEISQR